MVCSQCGRTVHDHDRFCMYCGHALTNDKTSVESRMKEDFHIEEIRDEKRSKRSAVNHVNLKHEAKTLFDHTTKSIGKFAGSEEVLNLNLKDMFSEVFKFHSRDESEEIFIAGTKKTTPMLEEVSEEWGKPWLFSRVFVAFAITFLALWILSSTFENELAIPGLIFIGALTVPLTGLIFFFESNAFKNMSLFEVLKMFFVGGVISLISTMILYHFVTFSKDYYDYGAMTVFDALMVGLVEEMGKALIIIYFVNKNKTYKILNGLLIGGAIGAGFAMFESAGYILTFSLNYDESIINLVFLRAWTAIGTHLVWSAIIGAAIVIAKEHNNFGFRNAVDKRFLFFFLSSVILHSFWDTSITFFGSDNAKFILLSVTAWLLIFILMKAGLKQVNILQEEARQMKEI